MQSKRKVTNFLNVYDLDLPGVMSFYLVPRLPRLVAMAAKFFMCNRKVSNFIFYYLFISFIFYSLFH